jgi:exosortase D (VPLPA-CTERM-specific)
MLQRKIDTKYWYVPLAIVLAGLALAYGSVITILVHQWLNNDDFSHGLLIVPITLYLIWEKRAQLAEVEIRTDWRALPVLLVAVCIFIIGELGAELFTTRISMVVMLIASIWLIYGYEVIRVIRFPLLFLFMMLPLPGFIYRNITFPLQLISSTWSVAILHLLGISAYREGNVIDMGFTQFQVVEACNGLRFILPLLTLGVLFAFWWSKETSLWKRVVLIVASVPIAILANVLRIAGTGIISMVWGTEAAEGFFHGFSGWVVFMLCFGFYALLNMGLKFLPGKVPDGKPSASGSTVKKKASIRRQLSWSSVAVMAVILIATPLAVSPLGSVPARPLQQPLEAFPLQYESWSGKTSQMDESIWNQVGGQDYIEVNYITSGEQPVNFYTAYYEYQRKAGDFVHSPKLCLPGAGWFIEKSNVREVRHNGDPSLYDGQIVFNEMVISKSNHRQLVYYWYQGRGRNFTNEYMAKFYMVWDGIFRRRTDGALVRLVRSIAPGETVEHARQVLDEFVVFTSQKLEEYLPS